MPAKSLVHLSPHRMTSSGTDTPGCPDAIVARCRSDDGPDGYQMALHETSQGHSRAPQLRHPIRHRDETQLPDERSGEPPVIDCPPALPRTTDQTTADLKTTSSPPARAPPESSEASANSPPMPSVAV